MYKTYQLPLKNTDKCTAVWICFPETTIYPAPPCRGYLAGWPVDVGFMIQGLPSRRKHKLTRTRTREEQRPAGMACSCWFTNRRTGNLGQNAQKDRRMNDPPSFRIVRGQNTWLDGLLRLVPKPASDFTKRPTGQTHERPSLIPKYTSICRNERGSIMRHSCWAYCGGRRRLGNQPQQAIQPSVLSLHFGMREARSCVIHVGRTVEVDAGLGTSLSRPPCCTLQERYAHHTQDEVQSQHWNQDSTTLFPCPVFFRHGDRAWVYSFVVLSDDRSQDNAWVRHTFKRLL